MFALFKSIFGADTATSGQYPEWLIEEAIERAVEGVDGRLRVLGGYRRRLRPDIIKTIDHVVGLVDQLPPPIDASRASYSRNPYLVASFASADAVQRFFSSQRTVHEYLDNLTGPRPDSITGLLLMTRNEKQVFSVDIQGEVLRRDVPETTVSFSEHILQDPCGAEEETRKQLKRRAFDHLVALALQNVVDSRQQRRDLEQQYTLLRRKLTTLKAEGWGLGADAMPADDNHAVAQRKLDEIETQLEAMPAKTELLNFNLDILADVLANSPQKLYRDTATVIVDRMNIKRDAVSDSATELLWNDFHSANGLVRTALMVSYPTEELLPRKKSMG